MNVEAFQVTHTENLNSGGIGPEFSGLGLVAHAGFDTIHPCGQQPLSPS